MKALLLLTLFAGCLTQLFSQSAGFDGRPLSIQTVSLFNQRTASRLATKSWKGDWIFRRFRLELVDRELRSIRPDLFLVQESMERQGSTSESDQAILRAGVLQDYEWRRKIVRQYDDTREAESIGAAVALPLKFLSSEAEGDGAFESWQLGASGELVIFSADYEAQPITVAVSNIAVNVPASQWLPLVREKILSRLKRFGHCNKRVILAGSLPGDTEAPGFRDFLEQMQLKDSASGYCQVASNCFTATPVNDIFLATIGDESPQISDRLLFPRSAYVSTSTRSFASPDAENTYGAQFGLKKLWPTQRFGWASAVRLARCDDKAAK